MLYNVQHWKLNATQMKAFFFLILQQNPNIYEPFLFKILTGSIFIT